MKPAALALLLVACAQPAPTRLPAPLTATPTALGARAPEPVPLDADEAGVDPAKLAALDADAARTHSDALVLWKDGRVLLHRRYTPEADGLIETMSITKSITALAVALLAEDGTLSVEEPLTRYFPEWKQGQKQRITLLHLLGHTSGLEDTDDTSEIWPSPDFVQLALTAELTTAPGTAFRYNNKAANLVPEVVRRASGEPIDRLLARRLFAPLGIERYEWLRDPQGHALGQSGLKLGAFDLARIGELLRRGGVWRGAGGDTRILAEATIERLTRRSSPLAPHHGLFFWIPESGHGFVARGYLGQRMLVLPARGVVAVRLRHWSPTAKPGVDDFDDFERRVHDLFERP